MTKEEFEALKPGDRVASRVGLVYDVLERRDGGWLLRHGNGTGQLALDPDYWTLVSKKQPSNPEHYKADKFETWDVIHAWQKTWPADIRYTVGSAVKYLSRLGRKPGANVTDDLEKAIAFLNKARELLKAADGQ